MRITKITNLFIRALFSATLISFASQAFGELQLPNPAERRPNLSADPFERAREAIKRMPTTSAPSKPAPAPEPQRDAPEPPPAADSTPTEQAAEPEPVDEPKPFSQEFILTADSFNLIKGGDLLGELPEDAPIPPSGAIFALGEYTAEMSTNALNLWDDGLFFLHAYGYFGNTATAILGDFHGLSGNDTGYSEGTQLFRLWEAWYEHNFPYNKSSFLIGVHDFNSEFYVLEYATLFLNGAFGTGTEVAVSANPSTYPTTTLGVRFKTNLRENAYFQIGLYDGTPGEMTKIFDVEFGKNDGFFLISELGFFQGEAGADGYYKVALGGWFLRKDLEYYTGAELAEGDTPPEQFEHPVSGTNGAYLLAETAIGDNLGIFLEAGWADPLYNRYSVFLGGGINYSGLIPGRADDVLGIGVVQSRQSDNYVNEPSNIDADGNPTTKTAETTFEVTYSARIFDWLTVQPSFEFVQGVNMDPNITDALVFGLRVQAVY